MSEILFLVFSLGVAASITAIYRVAKRSGVGFDSPIEINRLSREQRSYKRAKFWRALFDPEHKFDLILLASGFISSLAAITTLEILL